MNNLNETRQPEDIFEDIGPKPIIDKEKYSSESSENPQNPSNKLSGRVKPSKKKTKDIPTLIARLLIILAIIIAVGFGALYFWNKFENRDILIENEILTKPISNVTSTPLILPKEIKEKFLDSDADGLTDVEEKQLKTNINNPDTDNDGLSDRVEVKVYFTNPLSVDTDKDGISDGEEVRRGLDPDDPTPGAKLFDLEKEIKALEH